MRDAERHAGVGQTGAVESGRGLIPWNASAEHEAYKGDRDGLGSCEHRCVNVRNLTFLVKSRDRVSSPGRFARLTGFAVSQRPHRPP